MTGRVVVSSEVRKAREELVGHKEESSPEEKALGLDSEDPRAPWLFTNPETSVGSVYPIAKWEQ